MSVEPVHIFTIGFTRKSAEDFFTRLQRAAVRRVVDTRLNNVSQLAGFAKKQDLPFFLERIARIEYAHELELAPTQEMLDAYKKEKGSWKAYEEAFLALMAQRKIESAFPKELLHQACLLCSEETPERCHRRLVAEYLRKHWGNVEITHLI